MELPSELWERIEGFVSPDSLRPPSLREANRLLRRPTLDLLLLHNNAAPPQRCQRCDWSHSGFGTEARPV